MSVNRKVTVPDGNTTTTESHSKRPDNGENRAGQHSGNIRVGSAALYALPRMFCPMWWLDAG
jgi:hypothetical protein